MKQITVEGFCQQRVQCTTLGILQLHTIEQNSQEVESMLTKVLYTPEIECTLLLMKQENDGGGVHSDSTNTELIRGLFGF